MHSTRTLLCSQTCARLSANAKSSRPTRCRLADSSIVHRTLPFLSDFAKREVAAEYGVLIKDAGVANRATFVVDSDGKITYIEEGNSAIDPVGATDACSRSAHKAAQ